MNDDPSSVKTEVLAAVEALLAATMRGDASGVIAAYLPGVPVAEQGRISPRFEALAPTLRDFYASHRVTENRLSDIRIAVLGADVALLTAEYSFAAVGPDEAPFANAGAWSAVFVRRDGVWRIAGAHQSRREA
jgi:uncharacterized protein (TIGR02246 family)